MEVTHHINHKTILTTQNLKINQVPVPVCEIMSQEIKEYCSDFPKTLFINIPIFPKCRLNKD